MRKRKHMTEHQVVEAVRDEIRRAGSIKDLAARWSIVPSYICMVAKRRVSPGPKILAALGLEPVVVYRRKGA